jgi:hypothetical protein
MAKKPAEIVNGYKVPGGRGGAAVAKACQLIIQNPGIKQGDVLDQVTNWAKLNHSTANWITSPGPVRRWAADSAAFPMSTPTSSEILASASKWR